MWPFKKKEDDMDLPTLGPVDEPAPETPSSNLGMETNPLPTTPALNPVSSGTGDNELKVISAKLDTIAAKLENLGQRLENIEKIAADSQQPNQQQQWYKT